MGLSNQTKLFGLKHKLRARLLSAVLGLTYVILLVSLIRVDGAQRRVQTTNPRAGTGTPAANEELPNASSRMGLSRPKKKSFELEHELKARMLSTVLALAAIILVSGLAAYMYQAFMTGNSTELQQFCSSTFNQLLAIITAVIGYLFVRNHQKSVDQN